MGARKGDVRLNIVMFERPRKFDLTIECQLFCIFGLSASLGDLFRFAANLFGIES